MNNYNDNVENAIAAMQKSFLDVAEDYEGIYRTLGSRGVWDDFAMDYSRVPHSPEANMTVKPEYNQSDYQYYRPGEAEPRQAKNQMAMSLNAYKYVPIVRSVMDMMSDFTIDGIRITHRDRNKANFLKNWSDKVDFTHVSERIAHMLYTLGTAPVKILEGKLKIPFEKEWSKTTSRNEIEIQKEKYESRVIPLGYKILNPMTMEVIGGDIATYIGRPIYGLQISQKLKMDMQKLERLAVTNENFHDLLKYIPDELKYAVKAGRPIVPIDQRKLEVLFYKKNDWETWATPLLACIFGSLIQLEKLHLADSSALDGAISQIRLWRIGIYNETNPGHSILPNRAMINKLRNILARLGTGVLDLVWGPELEFKESSSQVHNYLGPEKYEQVMSEIHAGLGIPQTLTGTSPTGGNSGFTNNAISMKTLIERLEYGRKILIKFWNKEFIKIQKALGWRYPAQLTFDRKVLTDEVAEKKLIMDLWDRDVYSTETIVELCGRDPELEIMRLRKERRRREAKKMPEKASPYHIPQWELDLKKLILQGGGVSPSEVGLDLEPRKEGEKTRIEQQSDMAEKLAEKNNEGRIAQQKAKPKSAGGDGRPKNSKDKTSRKPRQAKPKSVGSEGGFVNLFMWANDSQEKLNALLSPAYLNHVNKKNLRSLTKEQFEDFEVFKFATFACFAPYAEINENNVYNILDNKLTVDPDLVIAKEVLIKHFENQNSRKPTVEEMRQIQSSAYALHYEGDEDV